MKKFLCVTILVALGMSLCACRKEKQKEDVIEEPIPQKVVRLHVKNEVQEADLWIIPNTEENRKSTLWGTVTVAKSVPGKEYTVEVTRHETKEYLLRMIDTNGMYYESGGITLNEEETIVISRTEDEIELTIYDADGNVTKKVPIFHAAL